jgi:hypothetical protein
MPHNVRVYEPLRGQGALWSIYHEATKRAHLRKPAASNGLYTLLYAGVYYLKSIRYKFLQIYYFILSIRTDLETGHEFILFFVGWAILKPPSKAVNRDGFASSLTKLWMMRWHVWLWQCACKLGWQNTFIV